MDDKELLEMAAKAAGAYWFGCYRCWYMGDNPWRPLTDDGDALRLAVKLRISVNQSWHTKVEASWYQGHVGKVFGVDCLPGDQRDEASRRCIVRAAAEIGKGMGVVE